MTGIYIASKTIHAARWRQFRDDGIPIISTWIDEAGSGQSASLQSLWSRCIDEAMSCTILVAYRANEEEVLKGGFIEVGAALAARRYVIAIGFAGMTFLHHPLVAGLGEDIDRAMRIARNFCVHHHAKT